MKTKRTKNKLKFGTISDLTGGSSGTDGKTIVGETSIAGDVTKKSLGTPVTQFLIDQKSSENFNFKQASDELKSFTYSYGWDSKELLPEKAKPSKKRIQLKEAFDKIIENDVILGEKRLMQLSRFGVGPIDYKPNRPRSLSMDTGAGDDESDKTSDFTMSTSSQSSLDSLVNGASRMISAYTSLWYFATKEAYNFITTGVATDEIKNETLEFYRKLDTYYTQNFNKQEDLQYSKKLIANLQNVAKDFLSNPNGLATFGMEYIHMANMKLQELYVTVFLTRVPDSVHEKIKEATYSQLIDEAKNLETRHHSPYTYSRLKKWLSINNEYNTPKSRQDWYRIQTIYFVKKRVLKYKTIIRTINLFAEGILSNDMYISYISDPRAQKSIILKTCIAEMTAAISGVFYIHNTQRILGETPNLTDSTPTTLRNVALVIFTQLAIIDQHIQLPRDESLESRERRTHQLASQIPDEILRQNTEQESISLSENVPMWLSLSEIERKMWMNVYKIAALILEKIIELTRIQGMQPGNYYDFDDQLLGVELEQRNFWNVKFATTEQAIIKYIENWKKVLPVSEESDIPIEISSKVGFEQPLYFIKTRPRYNTLHFLNIEIKNLTNGGVLDSRLLNFVTEFITITQTSDIKYTLLNYAQNISRGLFQAALVGKSLLLIPSTIQNAITIGANSSISLVNPANFNSSTFILFFRMTLSFLETTYSSIPWRLLWTNITLNNTLMLASITYSLCHLWNTGTAPRLRKPESEVELVELIRERIIEIPIFTKINSQLQQHILNVWGIEQSSVQESPVLRLQGIYLNLIKKPGLAVIYPSIISYYRENRPEKNPDTLYRELNITEIEKLLNEPGLEDALNLYTAINSDNGITDSKLLDTYLSQFDITNIIETTGAALKSLTAPDILPPAPAAPAARAAPVGPGPAGVTATQFGKLAKVFKPYREFVFDVKTTGAKRGIYVKTRFGIKKVKDDKYGLYVTADGKKFHLYKWGRP